ncbi:MAG: hypothetical protein K1X67_16140 [Fimbriimonadaceae bacterium]|nr:hypothetical protein [Fimbriimonadaceae bacterium]
MSDSKHDHNTRLDAYLDEMEAGKGRRRIKKHAGLASVGEILQQELGLDGVTRDRKPEASRSAAKHATGSKALVRAVNPSNHLKKILDAAEAIQARPDAADVAFMARQLVQATLPHSNPAGSPPEWYRTNGNFTLSIRPGYATDPNTGQRYCIGYPYGTIPRLLLFWLNTEVVRTRNRHIELGRSLADFMRQLGLDPSRGGKRSDAHRLRDQMHRLFRAQISFDETHETGQRWMDMQIAPSGEFWWDIKAPEQGVLWNSWIEVGEKFYQAILAAPVPVDMRALRALRKSPLALDLYAWSVHRTYGVTKKGVPQRLTWKQLQSQFGGDYTDSKDFKKKAKAALRKVGEVYPGLNVEEVDGGLIINPGRPAVIEQPKPQG